MSPVPRSAPPDQTPTVPEARARALKPARYLVLDLETALDTSLPPPKKAADGSEVFPAAPYHAIVVVGAALLDDACRVLRVWIVGEGRSERDMLAALVGYLNAHRDVTIVSYNGRGFDLPVIAARCLRYGLAFPWYYQQRAARHRYSADRHLDLMDFLVDHGATKSYGLDIAAKLIGMPGKLDCKGANVQAMIDAGEIEDVRAYCCQDVAQTIAIFLRTQLIRVAIDGATYERAMGVLLVAIGAEPRLAPLLPRIDRERLILPALAA
jgi:predicted PolB exonuclease-like 3'-5' exonuclease